MKPKVFTDLHNLGLFHSLQLLFEKRMGWELYRPIGWEWFKEGYWWLAKPYNDNEGTIEQFLGLNSTPFDLTPRLNDPSYGKDGIYEFIDPHDGGTNKGISLEAFKNMKFDIIIASIPDHIKPYQELIKLYQPQAKLIFQSGNIEWEKSVDYNNLNFMGAVKRFNLPASCHGIFYHEEFETDIFQPQGKKPKKEMVSFVNCLPSLGTSADYYSMKAMLPEYEFKSYGIACDNGIITGIQNIANIMNESYFGVHLKSNGDGYGAIIHNWFACGKPVIVNYETYKNQLAGELMIPDENCFTIDRSADIPIVIEKIRKLSPMKYEWMCQRSLNKFKEVCNFDSEAEQLKKFLTELI